MRSRRHLGPMVEAKQLERRYDEKNHPAQAYRAADGPLFSRDEPEGDR